MTRANEGIKFVLWAIGIGAGSTFMIITFAYATFVPKELSVEKYKALDARIDSVERSVSEIKSSNNEFQKWLRENWGKRRPE